MQVEPAMATTDAIYACETCGLSQRVEPLAPGNSAHCIRCGSVIVSRPFGGLEVTAALTISALVLYIPANLYPILSMNIYGAYTENTVWDGVVGLMNYNEYFVAAVVFLASIVIPLLKLIGLLFLVISVKWGKGRRLRGRTQIYKFIDVIGPWAMLDVFLCAILVALVKMGDLGRIIPGPGLIAFTAVVILTILASQSFDPKAIWNKQ
jgi:paraquat-inducible protein A